MRTRIRHPAAVLFFIVMFCMACVTGAQTQPAVPQIVSDWWTICTSHDLGDQTSAKPVTAGIMGHGFLKGSGGAWQLLASVRGTATGSVLFEWEGSSLNQVNWQPKGVVMEGGECENQHLERVEHECLLSPFFIQQGETCTCFYGGQGPLQAKHKTIMSSKQICMATSTNGEHFERCTTEHGFGMLFEGPGMNRDPMVLKIADLYYCYYYSCIEMGKKGVIAVRTSRDLIHWSEHTIVKENIYPVSWYDVAPTVVERDGYYYLFLSQRSQNIHLSKYSYDTHVFYSTNPLNFDMENNANHVSTLPAASPEIIQEGDNWYISTISDRTGIKLAKLEWEQME
jgi:hypothetical protein